MLLYLPCCLFGQGKYDANWCFGVKAGIDFNDTAHPTNVGIIANNYIAAASISDSLGNLLFYFAPDTPFRLNSIISGYHAIYGNQHQIIANGDSMITGEHLGGAIFINSPNKTNEFYLFYFKRLGSEPNITGTLNFCRIAKIGSSYSVSEKGQLGSAYLFEFGISATKHANGNDWWIVVHGSGDNNFYKLLLTKDGISSLLPQAIGVLHNQNNNSPSQLRFSKDGRWLVNTVVIQNQAGLFNFDRCTGQLFNYISLLNIDNTWQNPEIYGCEFSENSKKLFVSEGFAEFTTDRNGIYQYSLDTSDISSSKQIIWQDSGAYNSGFAFGDLRRAPNNKIYLAMLAGPAAPYNDTYFNPQNQNLWVINEPDSIGAACNFQPYGYYLGDSARTYYALPNMPNYNLGPTSVYAASAGRDTMWCSDSSGGVRLGGSVVASLAYSWSPSKGLNDSTLAQPTARPDTDTYYILTVTDTSQSGNSCTSRSDTVFVRVQQCDTTGIAEVEMLPVKVYPNPANDLLTVETSPVAAGMFYLYDLLGHVVLQHAIVSATSSISVSMLPQGLYFYKMGNTTGKVQVVR